MTENNKILYGTEVVKTQNVTYYINYDKKTVAAKLFVDSDRISTLLHRAETNVRNTVKIGDTAKKYLEVIENCTQMDAYSFYKSEFIGTAHCSEQDEFNVSTGMQIALNRAKIKATRYQLKRLSDVGWLFKSLFTQCNNVWTKEANKMLDCGARIKNLIEEQ